MPLGQGLTGRAWSRLVAVSMDADNYAETGADGTDYVVVEADDRGTIGFASAGVAVQPTPNSRLALEVGLRAGDDWDSRSIAASYSLTW